MITSKTLGSRISQAVIWVLVIAMALICLLPLLNMVAISFSSSTAASANIVGIYPVNPTLESYTKLLADAQFWRSFGISVLRVVLGASLNVLLTILMAYPLSKPKSRFKAQPIYMKFLLFTMLFSGGTIPIYLVVQNLGLVNSIWALILPTAVPVFNVIILMNFFKGTPDALEEAAIIDGAGQWTILFKIFLPISLPSLATVGLFSIVGHWNDYFQGLLYILAAENYPLQTYIRQLTVDTTTITDPERLQKLSQISNRTFNAAKIVVSTVPLLCIYPFLQKYFVTGITIGSVKG